MQCKCSPETEFVAVESAHREKGKYVAGKYETATSSVSKNFVMDFDGYENA